LRSNFVAARLDETENHAQQPGNLGNVGAPAIVLSRISSRSNSASAAKIPNTSRPLAVVVSILAPCPVRTRKANSTFHQIMDGVDEVTFNIQKGLAIL